MSKQLSFIDKQRGKGKKVADFALTLANNALHARLLCMEAARQLHKCEKKPLTKRKKHIVNAVSVGIKLSDVELNYGRRKNETARPKKRSV